MHLVESIQIFTDNKTPHDHPLLLAKIFNFGKCFRLTVTSSTNVTVFDIYNHQTWPKYVSMSRDHAYNFFMMTSSNGNIFRVTGHLCGEFPAQRPVTRSFDVFFDLHPNKRLSK